MPDFSMTMEIDDRGVILVVFEGVFVASEFRRQRALLFESRYAPADYDGRPVVSDIRRCALPRRHWADEFREVAELLRRRRPAPYRHAIVVGDELGSETAVALFGEYQRIFHHPDVEVRSFRSFSEAYAWALEALPAPGQMGA